MQTLTRDEAREVDRRALEEYGISGLILMENAGRGCADLLNSLGVSGPVCICCGKGNNAGDGFVIARHLEAQGLAVHVLLLAAPDDLRGDAQANLRILLQAGTPLTVHPADNEIRRELEEAEWVVDALLGTGLRGTVRPPLATVIESINGAGRKVLAVDLPSGMDCDSGEPWGSCVRADQTATFVAPKAGFRSPASKAWTGRVHVLPIGVPRALLAAYNF